MPDTPITYTHTSLITEQVLRTLPLKIYRTLAEVDSLDDVAPLGYVLHACQDPLHIHLIVEVPEGGLATFVVENPPPAQYQELRALGQIHLTD